MVRTVFFLRKRTTLCQVTRELIRESFTIKFDDSAIFLDTMFHRLPIPPPLFRVIKRLTRRLLYTASLSSMQWRACTDKKQVKKGAENTRARRNCVKDPLPSRLGQKLCPCLKTRRPFVALFVSPTITVLFSPPRWHAFCSNAAGFSPLAADFFSVEPL